MIPMLYPTIRPPDPTIIPALAKNQNKVLFSMPNSTIQLYDTEDDLVACLTLAKYQQSGSDECKNAKMPMDLWNHVKNEVKKNESEILGPRDSII